MEKPKIFSLFPKTVYVDRLEFDKKLILKEIDKLEFFKTNIKDPENKSDSSVNRSILDENVFLDLKNLILNKFYNYVKDVLKYTHNDFIITTSWVTKALSGESSEIHCHRNCMFSGVLYLKTEVEKAKISFVDFTKTGFMLKSNEKNFYNSDVISFNFSEDFIIFFPSEMYHKIEKNDTLTERISLAFNLIPIGKIGYETSDSYLEINKYES